MLSTAETPRDRDRRNRFRHAFGSAGRARRLGGSQRDVFEIATANVSRGGMKLNCPPEVGLTFARGDRLQVVFPADEAGEPLAVTGTVRWDGPDPWGNPLLDGSAGAGGESWQAGLEFEDAPAGFDRELLRRGGREPEPPPEG